MTLKHTEENESLLRHAGLLATRQRVELLGTLRKGKHPQSAEKLVTALKGKLNHTTVYRALEQLIAAGLARRIDLGKNHALFEFAGAHHHHLVCRSCGLIEDVTACIPSAVPKAVLKKTMNFAAIEDHALEFFGTCKPCMKRVSV